MTLKMASAMDDDGEFWVFMTEREPLNLDDFEPIDYSPIHSVSTNKDSRSPILLSRFLFTPTPRLMVERKGFFNRVVWGIHKNA